MRKDEAEKLTLLVTYCFLIMFLFPFRCFLRISACLLAFSFSGFAKDPLVTADICVYGETPAGITAAVQAARMGRSVVLVSTTTHVGGMATSGLTATDLNNFRIAGGVTFDFYRRIYDYYLQPTAWRSENREDFMERSKKRTFSGKNDSLRIQWVYESGVGEKIFREMLQEAGVRMVVNERLNRSVRPDMRKGRIAQILLESGLRVRAQMFIDASYEGDLMKQAGVSYIVGRESNAQYGETMNGIRLGPVVGRDSISIDPYRIPGNPASGLLPFIDPAPGGPEGSADDRTQTYCYRLTLTDDPSNRVAVAKPADYNPLWYEFLARMIALNPDIQLSQIISFTPMPNRKTDTNQGNFVGNSYAWPEAAYQLRDSIAQRHRSYSLGLLWFLGNDERLPLALREEMKKWGLPKDEYLESGHFPYQLYVREARRMIGEYVMTEADCIGQRPVSDPVAVATYPLDCHFVARVVDANGKVRVEGSYGKQRSMNYGISFRSILPRVSECQNLVVPVCVSASHVAYSSIRMEPVYMMLGQAAAIAAVLALEERKAVQGVSYDTLKKRLLEDGQVVVLRK